MKKQIKLFTNMTKPLVLFALLMTLGVGQMWGKVVYYNDGGQAGTPKVHFWGGSPSTTWDENPEMVKISGNIYAYDIGTNTGCIFRYKNASEQTRDLEIPSDGKNYYNSGWSELNSYAVGKNLYLKVNSNWKEGNPRFAACFCGVTGQTWVNCSQLGSSDYYSVSVPEGEWPMVIFVRLDAAKEGNNWDNKWDQTDDLFYEYDKNLCTITGWSNSQTRGQYAPNGAIHGSMNGWRMMEYSPFVNGSVSIDLPANSTYAFQIISGESWYGYGDNNYTHTFTGQTSDITLTSGKKDMLLLTAGAGKYTFTWNDETKTLSVAYPTVTHPSTDYVYVKKYSDWDPVNAHIWGGASGTSTIWELGPALSSINFDGTSYYYAALGDHNLIVFGQGPSAAHRTIGLGEGSGHESDAPTLHKGQFYDASGEYAGWAWKNFTATLSLGSQGETTAPSPSSVIVTYGASTNINTDVITTSPAKTGYTFGGYYTSAGGSGTQVIGSDEKIPSALSGYTADGKWIKTGSTVSATLYAKWTQDVTLDKEGGTSGSTSVGVTYNSATLGDFDNPEKSGYTYGGYYTGDDGAGELVISTGKELQANVTASEVAFTGAGGIWTHTGSAPTLHAKWTANPYTITLNKHNDESNGSVAVTFDANTNLTSAITIPKKTGYGFQGYYTGEGGTGTQIIDAEGNFIAGAGSNTYLDGSKNWKYANNITLHAYWVASAVTTPTVTAAMPAYIGEDITISLSAKTTNVAEPVVIFEVADNSNSTTYEVVATPSVKGSMPTYSTTHTATFTAKHAATYSVTAKVYSGKLIDNFDGYRTFWKALGNNESDPDGSYDDECANPAIQAANGSNTVMKITRGDANWKTVQTKEAANDESTTNWNLDYGYIYISMYSTSARTPKIKYTDDDGGREVKLADNSLSASTWTRKQFPKAADDSQIDFILPFIEESTGDILYIDDIILSNESSMTAQATSSSASTTITQPTIGSCTATAATTNWGGSNINISLSAQTTYLADAVVVFFVTDGSNSTTYEVTATPGTPGANNAITHTATFVAQHAATYSVTAKLYNGKFIDNFEGSATLWATTGYGGYEKVTNVEREANNGSSTVMKITRKDEEYRTAYTTTVKDDGTKPTSWNYSYNYIYMRYYAPQAETPKVQYVDNSIGGEYKNTTLSSVSADTWHHLQFGVTGGIVDLIYPFVCSGNDKYIYIDDIILSNRSTWAPIKNTSSVDLTADASDVTIREDYTVTLEDLGADEGHKGTSNVSVTYGATTGLTDAIDTPSKTHYDFGGYWTSSNSGSTLTTQLIDGDGNWIKDVTDYTGHDGDNATWLYADDITLYAKWTEKSHLVTVAVSAGTYEGTPGTVQISSADVTEVTAGEVTWSAVMTPIANPGWKFKKWQKTSNVDLDLENYHEDYQPSTDNSMRIKASANDQTLTAVFEPRFSLVGSEYGSSDTKGMPGWKDYTKTFTVNSSDPVNLTCSRTLEASTTYKFQIHDCAESKNLGAGTDGQYVLLENASAVMANQDKDVKFTSTGAGTYIFHITAIDGSYHPTVEILWPHQTNFGRRRVDIDGTAYDDNTGGTLVVKAGESTISTGSWHTYGTNIAYDADNQTGYQLAWYNSSSYSETFSAGGEWNHDLTSNDNCYAQFSELATKVSLENDGHGKVQIGGVDKTETTCGITTSRTITAVPNTGYSFSGWTKPSGDDLNFTADATNPKTFTSKGGGLQSGQRIYANFSAKTYSVKLNNDHGGASSDDGSATATYDATSLSSITDAQFSGWTLLGYWNSSAVQVVNANGSLCANVDGYTDSNGKWTNDAGATVNLYAHWSRSITLDDNGGSADGAVTVTYNSTAGTPTITTIPTRAGYSIEGYYTNAACTTKVMEPTGKLVKSVSGYTDSNGKWTKTDDATLYTKWIFVIYRTGDKADDPRKQTTDVESYAGGTISETIEFRMKVRELDKWYSLCLPFEVNAVKVWEAGTYYDLVPFYRPEVGGTFYSGDYIIRTPKQVANFPISEFADWRDPESADDYLPSKNTPYIIQWHDSYFAEEGGRYISFFGTASQEIPDAFSAGDAPSSDNVVNVCVNTSMQSGSVTGAYLLDPDYGGGAWLRNEDKSARTVLPFECFIRANDVTTGKYLVIRRDTGTNGATGFETVMPDANTNKVLINGKLFIIRDNKMYNVMGMEVQK